ncbi:hypothetical protein D3C87_2060710 [compost metagenome]
MIELTEPVMNNIPEYLRAELFMQLFMCTLFHPFRSHTDLNTGLNGNPFNQAGERLQIIQALMYLKDAVHLLKHC